MEWSKKYGIFSVSVKVSHMLNLPVDSDIIHLNAVGTSMIVLSSAEAINDLLEKRSSTYSDRWANPFYALVLAYVCLLRSPLLMVNELMGWDFALGPASLLHVLHKKLIYMLPGLMRYGEKWFVLFIFPTPITYTIHRRRVHRRMFHNSFNQGAAQNFHPKELVVAHRVLQRLVQDPEHFMEHFRQYATFSRPLIPLTTNRLAGELIMSITYGIDILPSKDPYISLAEKAMHGLSVAVVPGRFLVVSCPYSTILRILKTWRDVGLFPISEICPCVGPWCHFQAPSK
jgi:hypothetical protein